MLIIQSDNVQIYSIIGVRLKLDDNECRIKFKDVLFMLASLAAKDSFLFYYQEHLARRLLDSLS